VITDVHCSRSVRVSNSGLVPVLELKAVAKTKFRKSDLLSENKSSRAINIYVRENKLAKANEKRRFLYTKKDKKLVIIYQKLNSSKVKEFL